MGFKGVVMGDGKSNELEAEKYIDDVEDIYFRLNIFKDDLDDAIEDARNRKLDASELALTKIKVGFDEIYNLSTKDSSTHTLNKAAFVLLEAENSALKDRLEEAYSQKSNAHKSDALAKLNQASSKFWSNADPSDNTTHPLNKDVADWLVKDGGYKKTTADKGATIIRPKWATTGRKADK